MSASWRLNQNRRRLCGNKFRRQNPLITGFEPGVFGARGRRYTTVALSSGIFLRIGHTSCTVWEMWIIRSALAYVASKLGGSLSPSSLGLDVISDKILGLFSQGHYKHIPLYSSLINPFPHIYAFWRLCSRQLFENKVTKEEINQNEHFLLLPKCCPLLSIQL